MDGGAGARSSPEQGCGQQQAIRAWAVNWHRAGPAAPALLLTSPSVPQRPLSTEAGFPRLRVHQPGQLVSRSLAASSAPLRQQVPRSSPWFCTFSHGLLARVTSPAQLAFISLLTLCWLSGDITGPAISPGARAPPPAQGPSAARPWGLLTVPHLGGEVLTAGLTLGAQATSLLTSVPGPRSPEASGLALPSAWNVPGLEL